MAHEKYLLLVNILNSPNKWQLWQKKERKKERQKEKVTLYKYTIIKHQSIICKMLLNSLFIVYKL